MSNIRRNTLLELSVVIHPVGYKLKHRDLNSIKANFGRFVNSDEYCLKYIIIGRNQVQSFFSYISRVISFPFDTHSTAV